MNRVAQFLGITVILGCAGGGAVQAKDNLACAGLTGADRDRHGALLDGRDARVEKIAPLRTQRRIGKATMERPAGVRIMLRAEEGMNTPALQSAVDCALAHREALAQPGDPLAQGDVRATVRSSDHHFVVDLEAPSAERARAVEAHVMAATR